MKLIFALLAILAICPFLKNQAKAQSCGECEIVITFVETWVNNNATEAEISAYLDVACSTIFSAYEQTCDQIVAQGIAEIISYIQQDETPTQICTNMGFCTSAKADCAKIQDAECDECEMAVSTIETWLDNTNNQADVVTAVEVVCTYMPSWTSTCDAMIVAGVPSVVNWIDTNENSTVVCGQLELCGTTKIAKPIKNVGDECSSCQVLVGFIENWALNNATAEQIESYLDTLCPLIPDYTTQCEQIVNSEIPSILAQLEADENPAAICTQLGACTSGIKKLSGLKEIFHKGTQKAFIN